MRIFETLRKYVVLLSDTFTIHLVASLQHILPHGVQECNGIHTLHLALWYLPAGFFFSLFMTSAEAFLSFTVAIHCPSSARGTRRNAKGVRLELVLMNLILVQALSEFRSDQTTR